jgi:hypothetical protein
MIESLEYLFRLRMNYAEKLGNVGLIADEIVDLFDVTASWDALVPDIPPGVHWDQNVQVTDVVCTRAIVAD